MPDRPGELLMSHDLAIPFHSPQLSRFLWIDDELESVSRQSKRVHVFGLHQRLQNKVQKRSGLALVVGFIQWRGSQSVHGFGWDVLYRVKDGVRII